MSKIKDLVRAFTPNFLLVLNRKRKKKKRNKILDNQAKVGGWTKYDLIHNFQSIGIQKGDAVLVHSALSAVGFIQGGPITFIQALLECVGENGNILMPTSPNNQLQLNYIQHLGVFDVAQSPSKLGKITEVFRTLPNAVRSAHPTEPVSVVGPDAVWFTDSHHLSENPYGENSPWYKLTEKKGKILYVGCTLANAGTSLHCLEDAVQPFKYPVYYKDKFDVKVKKANGDMLVVTTKVHNPVYSKKRRCDELIPMFIEESVAQKVKVGEAITYLFDAHKMLQVMVEKYHKSGVTMYTPEGK